MASKRDAGNFKESLGCLVAPLLGNFAAQLNEIAGLDTYERDIIVRVSHEAVLSVVHTKLSRLLLLELNAARVTGVLTSEDSSDRWAEFLELSSDHEFWERLAQEHYPLLLPRIDCIVKNRFSSALRFAQRFASDRVALDVLVLRPLGKLHSLSMDAGDSHRGGQTVVLVHCDGGDVVYKPRSVSIDIALDAFLVDVLPEKNDPSRIRVPRVITKDGYGWAQWITHHYAKNPDELQRFYRGIGEWLAIMRLLGGSDLHAENLIAHGSCPLVVDCETLFTPVLKLPTSGLGMATDRANELLSGTALNIGLLPGRGLALAWRGVDSSALGSLPGQQPMRPIPSIVGAGSDQARLGMVLTEVPIAQNHPSTSPALADYWPEVLRGFKNLTAHLRQLDVGGQLAVLLQRFSDCPIRVVTRSTQVYGELARMLWHPSSLHQPTEAKLRAHNLLAGMAENVPIAPSDPDIIDAEIADLLAGDVPFFTALAGHGRLEGPQGTHWLPPRDLVNDALDRWRNADFKLEYQVIQASLVSAYINDGWVPPDISYRPQYILTDNLDQRRRREARRVMESLVATRIAGNDGSTAWIAPVLNPTGWVVKPLALDLYNGISGIALLVAGYLREVRADRADTIDGLDALLPGLIKTLELAQTQYASQRQKGKQMRMPPIGGYIGLGSQIWTWLILKQWGVAEHGIQWAEQLAELIPEAAAADEFHDVLTGKAGAIVPLLMLSQASRKSEYADMAIQLGDQLCATAQCEGGLTYWPHPSWPKGIGGFAHGATGIGWSLAKLAKATGEQRFAEKSLEAMAFEESLYDENLLGWRDLRVVDESAAQSAWCHGSVGIGLALIDLDASLSDAHVRSRVRAAAVSTWKSGIGSNHTLCHGDLGSWELLKQAIDAGLGPDGLREEVVLATALTSIETHGAVCGWAREAFSPSLLPGVGGVAYQLLRAHPESKLPSVLTLDGGMF